MSDVKVSNETISKMNNLLETDGVVTDGDLTPKEKCQLAHNGECGECAENGDFSPCG